MSEATPETQPKKVAVLLAGCGVYDGAEIYESVLTLLRLEEAGVSYQCFAPKVAQMHVVNHATGEEMPESAPGQTASRDVFTEAARLARGNLKDLADARPEAFDAVILPGGFGVAKNFSTFATEGADCKVDGNVRQFVQAFYQAGKPIGLMCIAPALATKLVAPGVLCTVGKDPEVTATLKKMGALAQSCEVDEIVVDKDHKLVTTPAYMLATRITEAQAGIFKLVDQVLAMTK